MKPSTFIFSWTPLPVLLLLVLTGCEPPTERVTYNDRVYQVHPISGCSSIETDRGLFPLYLGPGNQVTTVETPVCFKIREAIEQRSRP